MQHAAARTDTDLICRLDVREGWVFTGFVSIVLPIGRYVIYYIITKAQVTLQIKVARLQLFPSAHLRHLRFAGLWRALGRQAKIKGCQTEVAS